MSYFDWRANPASVFIIAIPLAGIGLGTGFLVALLHWVAGDPICMFIFFGILAISRRHSGLYTKDRHH